MQLRRVSDNMILASSVHTAQTFGARFRGLMARAALADGCALLLDPCRSIHTCFMRFDIDVIFLNRDNVVTGMSCHVKPWKLRLAPRGTRKVIEMSAGSVAHKAIKVKDQLVLAEAIHLSDNTS